MYLLEETGKIQEQLGDYCRTGKGSIIEGTRPDRLPQYRRLVFNVVKSNLKNAYPICAKILGEEGFTGLVQDFFQHHDCKTPQIWKLPAELLEHAKERGWAEKLGRPYLDDLLLFEWMEIEVYTMPDEAIKAHGGKGSILEGILYVNPEHRLINLAYPVHMKPAAELEKYKGNYFLLLFREPASGKVKFINLSPLHAWILGHLIPGKHSLAELITEARNTFNIVDGKRLEDEMVKFVSHLIESKAILGFL
jgi:hypothetical protein